MLYLCRRNQTNKKSMGQLAFLKLFILVAINEQITRTFNGEKTISINIEK